MDTTTNQEESSFGKLLYERLFKNKEGLIAFIILAVVLLFLSPLSLASTRGNQDHSQHQGS